MDTPAPVREQVLLAPFTTLGLGGHARYFARADSEAAIAACLRWAAARGLPVHVLGGGSNTVFADGGYPGLVLHLATAGLEATPAGGQVLVTAAAGGGWASLVDWCVDQGLGGVECLAGIPGQVGATPIQNVGAYGQQVGDVLWRLRVLDRASLAVSQLAAADCGLGYRDSRFRFTDRDRYVILSVTVRLQPGARPVLRHQELAALVRTGVRLEALPAGAPALRAVRDAVVGLRRQKSMIFDPADPESHSAGSFFVNPVLEAAPLEALRGRLAEPGALPVHAAPDGFKVSAAWLIEQAGFARGFTRHGVGVSARHSLSLVNRGGSTAALLELAEDIRRAVRDRFGVELRLEPAVVPAGP
jgi:UDP-N-acetylmuramate dehydrogenase